MNSAQKMKWLIGFRLAFIAVMGVSSYILHLFYNEPVSNDVLNLIGSGAGFCIISWSVFAVMGERRVQIQLSAQLLWDLGYASTLIAITGGLYSAFTLLYCIYILLSAIALDSKGAIAFSMASAAAVAFISFIQNRTGFINDPNYLSRLIFSSSALLLFGGVVGWLFRNRERLARILEKTTADLRDLSELHTAIVDHVSSGIIYADNTSKVRLMNEAAFKILEKSWVGTDLKSSELSTMFNPDSRSETKVQTPSGVKILGHHVSQLPDGGYVIVFQNVTDIRALEQKVQLQDKLATVGQLAAGIAHEIRNPLASLSGSIQLMKSEMKTGEATDRLMTIILRETDRLDQLLQNFLNYAKPSSLYLEKVKLLDICNEVIELLQNAPEFQDGKLNIQVKVDRNLEAECDPKQLKQILWNLLKNAAQAITGSGHIRVKAEEIQGEANGAILFSVEDSGSGIPKSVLNRVFDPFYTTKASGTGLGLALVYQMVKTHGGRIGVESEEGKGTRVWFEFPKIGRLQSTAGLEVRAAG